jgi:hypothetical protein
MRIRDYTHGQCARRTNVCVDIMLGHGTLEAFEAMAPVLEFVRAD